jgi:hypothetical protein
MTKVKRNYFCCNKRQIVFRTAPLANPSLGRLLASGRAGHESVPQDDRPRGRETCKVARQPA